MKEPLINMELIIFVEEICRNLQDPVKWKQKLAKTLSRYDNAQTVEKALFSKLNLTKS